MPFEAWQVSNVYTFRSNAKEALGGIARLATAAADALEKLDSRISITNAAMMESAEGASLLRGELGGISRGYSSISAAATGAATRVTSASNAMRASMAEVGSAASIAQAKVAAFYRTAGIGPSLGGRVAAGAGNAGIVGGLAAAVTLGVGIDQSAKTQQLLSAMSVQTGRSQASLAAEYMPIVLAAGNRTGMSAENVLGIAREVSGVIKDPRELRQSLLGTGGKGGIFDLVSVLTKTGVSSDSPTDISRLVIRADHILNAYTAKDQAYVNDRLYRSAVGSHMELGPLVTQLGYFGETFRLARGRPAAAGDILSLAQLGYWGVGTGKWGAGFGQILNSILSPTKAALPRLIDLGVLDKHGRPTRTTVDANGSFTPIAMIRELRENLHNRRDRVLPQRDTREEAHCLSCRRPRHRHDRPLGFRRRAAYRRERTSPACLRRGSDAALERRATRHSSVVYGTESRAG